MSDKKESKSSSHPVLKAIAPAFYAGISTLYYPLFKRTVTLLQAGPVIPEMRTNPPLGVVNMLKRIVINQGSTAVFQGNIG